MGRWWKGLVSEVLSLRTLDEFTTDRPTVSTRHGTTAASHFLQVVGEVL